MIFDKKESQYDSTQDTVLHKLNVEKFIGVVINELTLRASEHDNSKLISPEKETYDKYIPQLQKVEYGTNEYYHIKDKMFDEGLKHHYEVNPHHPEYYKNGISGMNLIDIVEMFCDWYAASLRSDTGFLKGLDMNRDRYKMSDELYSIFKNTIPLFDDKK